MDLGSPRVETSKLARPGKRASVARWLMLVAVIAFVASPAATADKSPIAKIIVKTAPLGREIPEGFVGISLEVSAQGQGLLVPPKSLQMKALTHPGAHYEYALGRSGAPNAAFFRFMRNLGPSTLRLGGNSQDNTCWDAQQAPHPSWCNASITPGDLRLWAHAAAASGWRLMVGINLKQNSPSWALKEVTDGIAKYIPRDKVVALEIGNEPSLFPRSGARPKDYSPRDQVKDFLEYVRAFHENPVAKQYAIAGPAACCAWENTSDLETFMNGVGPSNLKLVTVHEYVKTVCGNKVVTIPELLAPETTGRFVERAKKWIAEAQRQGLPLALAETNSVSCGGMPGVSNSFASAVWGLNYMFSAAHDGLSGINFHMSYKTGGSPYSPVEVVGWQDKAHQWHYTNTADPLYYAMYMFAHNAEGSRLLSVVNDTTANIRADAVRACPTCAVRVFLINEDLKAAGPVSVHIAGARGAASLLLLRAPALDSLADAVKYGGVQFDGAGRLPPPHATRVLPDAHGDYVFALPNAAAALLTTSSKGR